MASLPSFAHTQCGAPYEPPLSLAEGSEEYSRHVPATQVDKKDADTPDAWVKRDPRILRLTGRHPLNCEPPMDVLMGQGFITPPSLHFVRNHGSVPRIEWSNHRIHVNGLVDKPLVLTMDDLVAMPSVTFPVTLVCAGNRRKEENMVKKSIGFNWGPSATSCTYWTGVRLRDLLLAAGVKSEEDGARYVSFRGPKGELPKGSDGSYGTSVTMAKAMDMASDVIIAYKQNHRWLLPDHGFPVRMLVPGHIGGRMVKYLSEITVTEVESDNFYHYHDNRVLPSHVDEALAKEQGWWFKPDFIINDLNINSAVARPWHDEVLSLKENTPYTVKGYAYAGGGRKIIRVEISLDDGATWQLAEIRRFEKPNAYGKYWCWVHWDIEVPRIAFLRAKELLLRAWDDAMNTQPAVITWNLMGMMNNCLYRIRIHPHVSADGSLGLRFQHPAPVEVGALGNVGWREEEHLAKQALEAPAAPPPLPKIAVVGAESAGPKTFTMKEVEEHTTEESAWFVYEGKVYDATPFLEEHPGGAESILITTGMDATDEFNAIHSSKAKKMLLDYYIGDLVDAPSAESSSVASPAASTMSMSDSENPSTSASTNSLVTAARIASGEEASTSKPADDSPITLNPRTKIKLPLIERIELSRNSRIFRFGLPSPSHRLGLPVGKHVFTYASIGGENVMRAYTPTSCDDDKGILDLLIKVYFSAQHESFPLGGKMSQFFDSLKIGDHVEFKGPVGHFVYEGRGSYSMGKAKGHTTHMSFLAGGTGITPCYQVIKAVLKDPSDPTLMSLLYANQMEEDILLRKELEAFAAQHPTRFKLYNTLSQAPKDGSWSQGVGRMTEAMLREHLFPAGADMASGSEEPLGLMCGPKGMIEHVCIPALKAMGYAEDRLVEF